MKPGERGSDGTWFYEACIKCAAPFAMTAETQRVAKRSGQSVFCPHGHSQVYVSGPTEADKLRQERDLLKQQLAERDDRIRAERKAREDAERSASAARGQVTKIRNRIAAGTCPCCNRTFQNLHRHMQTKHPELAKEKSNERRVD